MPTGPAVPTDWRHGGPLVAERDASSGERAKITWVARDGVIIGVSAQLLESNASSDDGRPAAEVPPHLASDDSFLSYVVLALRELARVGDPALALHAESLAAVLTEHLVRAYGVSRPKRPSGRGQLSPADFGRVTAFIDERLGGAITLRELASVTGMTVCRFARLFKARVGVSPHHWVLERRLDRARALLCATTLPVGDIGIRCGFSNPSHFTNTFQRLFGTTPTRYRQDAKGR